jgi:hypothetical protein
LKKKCRWLQIDVYDNDRIREFKEFIDNTKDPRKRRGFLEVFMRKQSMRYINSRLFCKRRIIKFIESQWFLKQAEEIVHPKFY